MVETQIRCTTKGCTKLLATMATETRIAIGFVHLICPRCGGHVYIQAESVRTDSEDQPQAA